MIAFRYGGVTVALTHMDSPSDAMNALPPDATATARYAFLHEGILRSYLSKLGEHAKDAAIYWKYGCWFYEKTTRSQVLIESKWDDAASEAGAGDIRFRAWGENSENLIDLGDLSRLSKYKNPCNSGLRRGKRLGPRSLWPRIWTRKIFDLHEPG